MSGGLNADADLSLESQSRELVVESIDVVAEVSDHAVLVTAGVSARTLLLKGKPLCLEQTVLSLNLTVTAFQAEEVTVDSVNVSKDDNGLFFVTNSSNLSTNEVVEIAEDPSEGS